MLDSHYVTQFDSQMSFNPNYHTTYSYREADRSTSRLKFRSTSANVLPRNSKLTLQYNELDDIQVVHQHSSIKGYPGKPVDSKLKNLHLKIDFDTTSLNDSFSKTRNTRASKLLLGNKSEGRSISARPTQRAALDKTLRGISPEPAILTELSQYNDKLPSHRRLVVKAKVVGATSHKRPELDEILSVSEKLPVGGRMEVQSTDGQNLTQIGNISRKIVDDFMYTTPLKSGKTKNRITPKKTWNLEDNLPTEEVQIDNPRDSRSFHSDGRFRTLSSEVFTLESTFSKIKASLKKSPNTKFKAK